MKNSRGVHLVLCLCILGAVGLSCANGDKGLLRRRETAIRTLDEYYVQRDAGPIWTKVAHEALVALTNATVESLEHQLITSAVIIEQTNQSVHLWVHWIAAKPGADRVEVDTGDGTGHLSIALLEQTLKDNEAGSAPTVLFNAGFGWSATEDTARKLNSVPVPERVRLRLVRGTVPLTDWHRISIYRGGKWVSASGQEYNRKTFSAGGVES
jgi:hypothetical protein